jgi:hypothetical protein
MSKVSLPDGPESTASKTTKCCDFRLCMRLGPGCVYYPSRTRAGPRRRCARARHCGSESEATRSPDAGPCQWPAARRSVSESSGYTGSPTHSAGLGLARRDHGPGCHVLGSNRPLRSSFTACHDAASRRLEPAFNCEGTRRRPLKHDIHAALPRPQ